MEVSSKQSELKQLSQSQNLKDQKIAAKNPNLDLWSLGILGLKYPNIVSKNPILDLYYLCGWEFKTDDLSYTQEDIERFTQASANTSIKALKKGKYESIARLSLVLSQHILETTLPQKINYTNYTDKVDSIPFAYEVLLEKFNSKFTALYNNLLHSKDQFFINQQLCDEITNVFEVLHYEFDDFKVSMNKKIKRFNSFEAYTLIKSLPDDCYDYYSRELFKKLTSHQLLEVFKGNEKDIFNTDEIYILTFNTKILKEIFEHIFCNDDELTGMKTVDREAIDFFPNIARSDSKTQYLNLNISFAYNKKILHLIHKIDPQFAQDLLNNTALYYKNSTPNVTTLSMIHSVLPFVSSSELNSLNHPTSKKIDVQLLKFFLSYWNLEDKDLEAIITYFTNPFTYISPVPICVYLIKYNNNRLFDTIFKIYDSEIIAFLTDDECLMYLSVERLEIRNFFISYAVQYNLFPNISSKPKTLFNILTLLLSKDLKNQYTYNVDYYLNPIGLVETLCQKLFKDESLSLSFLTKITNCINLFKGRSLEMAANYINTVDLHQPFIHDIKQPVLRQWESYHEYGFSESGQYNEESYDDYQEKLKYKIFLEQFEQSQKEYISLRESLIEVFTNPNIKHLFQKQITVLAQDIECAKSLQFQRQSWMID